MKLFILIAAFTLQTCSSEITHSSTKQVPNLTTKRVFSSISVNAPVVMTQEPKDKTYFYVVEQAGTVLRFKHADGNNATKETFADLRNLLVSGGEKGLLGMAFHPDYPNTPHVFFNYTTNISGKLHTRIARFTVVNSRVDASSVLPILQFPQPFENHNGGQLDFGPDGYLYIATGDGGSGGDPHNNGQNKNTFLGKILRIDINKTNGNLAYASPADNPFVNQDGLDEIYAYGLRNPWKFSFDTADGTLWAADVGQNQWEEVNIIVKGGNYGWKIREGMHCYNAKSCNSNNLIDPIVEYDHSEGQSITGGYVYHGSKIPALNGYYVYGDFVTGRLWGVKKDGSTLELPQTSHMISGFGQDQNGEVYILDYKTKQIFQLDLK